MNNIKNLGLILMTSTLVACGGGSTGNINSLAYSIVDLGGSYQGTTQPKTMTQNTDGTFTIALVDSANVLVPIKKIGTSVTQLAMNTANQ